MGKEWKRDTRALKVQMAAGPALCMTVLTFEERISSKRLIVKLMCICNGKRLVEGNNLVQQGATTVV
jgi:hypothetical protein